MFSLSSLTLLNFLNTYYYRNYLFFPLFLSYLFPLLEWNVHEHMNFEYFTAVFSNTTSLKQNLLHSEQSVFFFFTLFYFTILYWFCHTLRWIHHGCIQAPSPESPSHLPPHIISLDYSHAPAPSILYPVSNIDWHFVCNMIVYMFQCRSPKSSHPLPLPQSPKVRSIHLCLFCCLAYRVTITIFLNSVYMSVYCIGVFLSGLLHSI